jgi:hypothetical protein
VHRLIVVDGPVVILSDVEGREIRTTWEQFKKSGGFGIPSLGLRNAGPTMLYYTSMPARQSNRGYLPDYIRVHEFDAWETRAIAKPRTSSWEVAKEIFYPTFFTLKEAVKLLDDGQRIGCAITPNVGVYSSGHTDKAQITYKRKRIGFIDEGEVVFNSKEDRLIYGTAAKDLGVTKFKEQRS